jgi:hypothetical protein
VTVAEDAVRLLRNTGFAAIAFHWMGSVPLALALLLFWSALVSGGMTNRACAWWSLALALLYLWMHSWRAVYAGRLRQALEGSGRGARWTVRRVARLAAVESFLGASKLAVWPMALLVGFPFARMIAFFRYAAALSGSGDLDSLQLIARARRLAPLDNALNWSILPIQWLLGLAVSANLALTFAVLPALVRMLTGYESAFSRSQGAFTSSPLFLLFVLAASWVAFDPFVQAIYCVRCFQAESLETGEDLRARLRRMRGAVAAGVLAMLLLAMPSRAAASVSAGELEQAVREAMQSPEYAWRLPRPPVTGIRGTPWVVALTERLLHAGAKALQYIGRGIAAILKWIFGQLGGMPDSEGGAMPRAALHWSVYLLIAAAAGAILFLAWRKRIFRRRKQPAAEAPGAAAIRLEDEDVAADRLPESRWLELAGQLLGAQNFRLALRAFYLANLAWLGQAQWVTIDPGKTNREYQLELERRARAAAEARALFAENIAAFERCWYGMHGVAREDVEAFRGRVDEMKERMA